MSLTREDLENGLMLRIWREANRDIPCKTNDELNASADQTLDAFGPAGDPWVFGYGSLIWNPLLDYDSRVPATLNGYHRRFCLWSRTGRGTPERPGLVLGLDHGGSCTGVAYRIPREKARCELRLLWRREMLSNAYEAHWMPVQTCVGEIRALTFVINRENANYAGDLSTDQLVEALSTACGRLGSSRDYLCQTVEGLLEHGVRDPLLDELHARVTAQAALESPDND